MLLSVNPDIRFPCETLLFTVVEGASELGLCLTGHFSHIVRAKEMVKQEHISIPSIPGPQSRFDIDKTRMFAIQTLRLSYTKDRPVCGALDIIY
jgi:hypothetical protein